MCFSWFFLSVFSESNRSAAKPTSWPRSRIESHTPKVPTPDRRKPHSSTQSSRNHHSSIRRMKRFQKSTAIYTLPNREKRPVDKVGKCICFYRLQIAGFGKIRKSRVSLTFLFCVHLIDVEEYCFF